MEVQGSTENVTTRKSRAQQMHAEYCWPQGMLCAGMHVLHPVMELAAGQLQVSRGRQH